MEQINGANLVAFCSLAQQAEDSAITTQNNMEALVKHYVALQTENMKLRAQCQYMTEELREERDDLLQARAICPECAKKIDEAAGIDLVGLNSQLAASQAYAAQLRVALLATRKDLVLRAEMDTEDGGAILNISNGVLRQMDEALSLPPAPNAIAQGRNEFDHMTK